MQVKKTRESRVHINSEADYPNKLLSFGSRSEPILLLSVMGESDTGISVERAKTFLGEERIPDDYIPRSVDCPCLYMAEQRTGRRRGCSGPCRKLRHSPRGWMHFMHRDLRHDSSYSYITPMCTWGLLYDTFCQPPLKRIARQPCTAPNKASAPSPTTITATRRHYIKGCVWT
jgi:hypothetical protein